MGQRQRTIGRVLTAIGLASAVGYLFWRALYSISADGLWLALPVLAMEAAGFVGAALLAWALWPERPRTTTTLETVPTDVVVVVSDQPLHELRATMVALRDVRAVAETVVVDLGARREVAELAAEFSARYAATDRTDRGGLGLMAAEVGTPTFALLDAGDIPTHDFVERLSGALADERVAVAQGHGVSFAVDSAEHGPGHRHELEFERSTLNPALGRRGCAIWTGSGSVVRTEVVRASLLSAATDEASTLESLWRASGALLAAGWRIVAPDDTAVVAHRAVNSESAVSLDRTHRARAARGLLLGPAGALRRSSLTVRDRAALLAWSVRPLSPFRRSLFIALVAAALLAGTVPLHGAAMVLVLLWVPAVLYTSFGLALLSGWTLVPGDRARWSLRAVGPAWASLRSSGGPARSPSRYGEGLTLAIVGLSAVLVVRGISDRWTHTLGSLPRVTLMGLLLVCLWTLALSLDVLRVLARRSQQRRIARVVSSLSAVLDDRGVSIVDITPMGAGLTNHHATTVGAPAMLESAVSTASGVTDLRLDCVVRNCRPTEDGGWRIGVEFTRVPADAANALAEFCSIEPVLERLGVTSGFQDADARQVIYVDEAGPGPLHTGRLAVRLISLLALVGTVASTASTASASPSFDHEIVGVVELADELADAHADDTVPNTDPPNTDPPKTDPPNVLQQTDELGTAAVIVVGVCSTDAGEDSTWGTSDDAYGEPVLTQPSPEGTFRLDLVGEACWATLSLPADLRPTVAAGAPTGLVALDLSAPAALQFAVAPVASEPAPLQSVSVAARRNAAVAGVHSTLAQVTAAASSDNVALPSPTASQVATGATSPSTLSVFVLMLAGLLAASILVGSVRVRPPANR